MLPSFLRAAAWAAAGSIPRSIYSSVVTCGELSFALGREPVIPGLTVVLRRPPERGDPASILQAMQGRVERSVFHLKHLVRAPFYGVCDCLAMGGAKHECLEDQHVQGSLNHLRLERGLASRHIVLSMIDHHVSLIDTLITRKGQVRFCDCSELPSQKPNPQPP